MPETPIGSYKMVFYSPPGNLPTQNKRLLPQNNMPKKLGWLQGK
jgi:hypothetical protein